MAWILIVEDSPDLRDVIQRVLGSEGYDARTCENGQTALRIIRETPQLPSLVLLDLMMPVMDGWEFLAEIVKDASLSKIAIVVCSATPKNIPVHVPFLKKPLDLTVLIETAEKYVGSVEVG